MECTEDVICDVVDTTHSAWIRLRVPHRDAVVEVPAWKRRTDRSSSRSTFLGAAVSESLQVW